MLDRTNLACELSRLCTGELDVLLIVHHSLVVSSFVCRDRLKLKLIGLTG